MPRSFLADSKGSIRRVTALALVAVAIVLLDFRNLFGFDIRRHAGTSSALVLLGVFIATRARTVGRAVWWCVATGSMALLVETGLDTGFAESDQGHVFGLILLGSLSGLMCSPAAASVARAATTRAFDALHTVLAATGIWLAVIGASLCTPVLLRNHDPSIHALVSGRAPLAEYASFATLAAGIALASVGVFRQQRQLRWIAKVYRGQVPGWSIDKATDHPEDASRWALLESVRTRDGVLAREPDHCAKAGDAFRTLAGRSPVAVVDLDPTEMLRSTKQQTTRLMLAVAIVWVSAIALVLVTSVLC